MMGCLDLQGALEARIRFDSGLAVIVTSSGLRCCERRGEEWTEVPCGEGHLAIAAGMSITSTPLVIEPPSTPTCPVCGRPIDRLKIMRRRRWVYVYAAHGAREPRELHQLLKLPKPLWDYIEDYIIATRC